jgi:protoheme IX farnesyltransferase
VEATSTIEIDEWPMHRPKAALASAGLRAQSRMKDFWELTKPRMNFLVLVTTMAGYYMATRGSIQWSRCLSTLVGTALVAAAASVLNQVMERRFDAVMPRTAHRPLPARRVRPIEAWLFGIALSIIGTALLMIFVNFLTALLAAITLATYLLLYTPAKRHTTLCTLVGAVPGALPAMMGFTAADGAVTSPALALFGILFVWQIPHFLSIAILYRDDYAQGGFRMLPVGDERFKVSTRQIVLYSLALIPMTLVPVSLDMVGMSYFFAAIVLGIAFCGFGINWGWNRTRANARHLFFASIVYLPVLLALMTVDKR